VRLQRKRYPNKKKISSEANKPAPGKTFRIYSGSKPKFIDKNNLRNFKVFTCSNTLSLLRRGQGEVAAEEISKQKENLFRSKQTYIRQQNIKSIKCQINSCSKTLSLLRRGQGEVAADEV
jgi:hypothetical protein